MSEDIDFSNPQVIVSIGKPRSGKTNSTKYFILKNTVDKHIFKFGIVFTSTKFNEDYDYIPQQHIHTDYTETFLKDYMNKLEKVKKKHKDIPDNFVIFDDMIGMINTIHDKTLINFIASHRHYRCSVFFNFQYLYAASPLLREVSTYALMFNTKGDRSLKGLYFNFGQLFNNYNDFKQYFMKNTQQKYSAILFSQEANDLEENYHIFIAPPMDDYDDIKLKY
jgi:hypothetical protein